MLYAVGEILILIIGILIALQVNNWNEERQKRILEISILKTMKSDLEQDLERWKHDIDTHKEVLKSIPIVLDHLENQLPQNDALNYHFLKTGLVSTFSFHSGSLETLKSTGINIISNEELRTEIVDLYTYWFDYKKGLTGYMLNWHDYGVHSIFNTRFIQADHYDDYSTEEKWDGDMVPLDYESLFVDDEYKYYLLSYRNNTIFSLNQYLESAKRVKNLISEIEAEIKKLEV
jgi:hypothetical protein